MRKDYAKHGIAKRNKPAKETVSFSVILAIFISVLVIALMVMYVHANWKEKSTAWIAHAAALIKKKKPVNAAPPVPLEVKKEEVQFDFYTALPKGDPTFSFPEKKDQPSGTAPVEKYYVQLGIFKNALDASQLRLSLLLSGVEADVVKVNNQSYSVQLGPYMRETQAKSMQQRLSKKGFDSSVIKQ